MGHIVQSAVFVAHTPRGDVYVAQGGELPDDTMPEQIEQGLESGMLGAKPPTDAASFSPFAGTEDAPNPPDDGSDEGLDDGVPSGNASQAEWAAYAIDQGMPEDEARAASRNDLRDKYSA